MTPPAATPPPPMPPPDRTGFRALLPDLLLATFCAVALVAVSREAFAPARATPVSAAAAIGTVEERQNDVRRRTHGQLAWDALRRGAAVHVDDAVYAGEDSQALLVLEDGARISLDESSLVIVRPLSAPATPDQAAVTVEVVRGGARGISGSRPLAVRAGGAEVKMGAGGEVRIRESGDGAAVEVSRGNATLASAGRMLSVGPGQRVDAPRGAAATVETLGVKLRSPAPHARVRAPAGQGVPVTFEWANPDARPCEVELSDRPDFARRLEAWRTSRDVSLHPGLAAGVFHWRVRCGDARSEEWTFAVIEDRPPVVLAPRDGEVLDLSQRAELASRWTGLADEAGYELELAADGDFSRPVKRVHAPLPAARVAMELPEGRYCLRVRAGGPGRAEAPWSSPHCFRTITRPILEAPKVFEPVRESLPPPTPSQGAWLWNLLVPTAHAAPARSALVLRWEKIPGATAYLLEIAEDRDFKKLLVRERTTEAYYRWDIIARRDYWWRVRGIDSAGREGQVSERVKIGSEVAPPTLASPPSGARLDLPADAAVLLRWNGGAVFTSYRVELAADAAFTQMLESREVAEPRLSFTPGRLGTLYWRVSGIDLVGQSTDPSEVRPLTLVPPPPEPAGPLRVVATTAEELIPLAWSRRPVARYEVELVPEGESAGVRTVTVAKGEGAPEARVAVARGGKYGWRVRGLDPVTGWSPVRALEVVPSAPRPTSPANGARLIEGEPALLEWEPVALAERYELELTSADGTKRAERVTEPAFAAGALAAGAYTWSVRAVGGGALTSDPSPAFAFAVATAPRPVEVGQAALAPPPRLAPPALQRPISTAPRDRLRLSASAAVVSNFGGVLSPALAGEVAWLPARLDGRGAALLRVSGFGARLRFASTHGRDVEARLFALPLELLAAATLPAGPFELTVGAGPVLRWVQGEVRLEQGPRLSQAALEVGGALRARASRRLGPGSVFVELGSALTTTSEGLLITSPLNADLGAGYRWEVW